MYTTLKPKEVVSAIDIELGTAWKSGSAAEIVATLEGYATAIALTTSLSATNILATDNAPGTQAESTVLIGQKDSTGGSKATLDIELEDDPVVVGTFTASHKVPVWINGTEYHISLDAV